ncbi:MULTISPECIES: hypothetical protein [unclassified Acinetobacter]|uniref:hypothetical protein n=1 Tax=Acinetobacter TaxID=469 RepID=UPI001EF04841|nr:MULTISPECIES: hypothetical protein [unclassified Acinetobacter]MCG7221998.1 hypothetical protein [Acinetobacter sp. AG3]UOH17198.1 hypothetical protein MTO68_15380 [Acinetobacter sp. NyZ410]
MSLSIKEIRANKPNGTTHFRTPHSRNCTNYYRVEPLTKAVLYWSNKDVGFWIRTDLTIEKLADLGAMPIDYVPIDWVRVLEAERHG